VEVKTFEIAECKTFDEPGSFELAVSVYGNVDLDGDIVEPGAFARSLAGSKGRKHPVVWSHQVRIPPIGVCDYSDSGEKLIQRGTLFVGSGDRPHALANEVYNGMKHGAINQASFSYDVIDSSRDTMGGKTVRRLKELALLEAGPCVFGANPDTHVVSPPKTLAAMRELLGDVQADLMEELGRKAMYGTSTDYLVQAIGAVTSYIDVEEDEADVATAKGIANSLANLLKTDIGQKETSVERFDMLDILLAQPSRVLLED
jgi:HK97 family phage prohead protease